MNGQRDATKTGTVMSAENLRLADEVTAHPGLVSKYSDSFTAAKGHIKNGNPIGAIESLAPYNLAMPGSAEWHLETSARLLQVAEQLRVEGNARDCANAAAESLQQLEKAEKAAHNAKDPEIEARAKLKTAFIQLRHLGQTAKALESYAAALELVPENRGIRAEYERLRQSYDTMLARVKSPRK